MKKRPYDVLVIGGYGHVGLPLGLVLADAGLQVALYDVDQHRGEAIRRGHMPFLEYDAEPILQRVLGRSLHVAQTLEVVSRATAVVITIGTPQDEYLHPRLLPVLKLAESLCPFLRNGHQVMLRSTVYPGTSERLHSYFHEQGCKVHLAFCPERIAQGYAIRELRQLPQIVSGFTPQALAHATTLFRRLGIPIIELSVNEAELANDQEADFARIHHAMTFGYDRAGQFPTAGFTAGPCLLKDTMQLCSDEYVRNDSFVPAATVIEACPVVIVGVPHRAHRHLAVPPQTHLVDLWGIIQHRVARPSAGTPPTRRRRRRQPARVEAVVG